MYNDVIDKIREFDTIVIARHIGVDPDALCSQLALRDIIRLNYPEKKVYAIGTGSQKFLSIGKLDKIEKFENALLIVCDTPDLKRVDSAKLEDFSFSIKIDHHPFIEKFCDIEIIDDCKTSTCELLMNMFCKMNFKCNSSISELLYIGFVSDSNRFLFNSCTADSFSLISYYLEKYPFDLSNAYQKLYLRPLSEVRLEGYISLNLTVTENGLAYIVITDDVLRRFGVDSASPANMINRFNYIREVSVWMTITEDIKNCQYRVSVRSRGPEINVVAESYKGGGHKFASGVRFKTLDEAMNMVKDLDCLLKINNQKEGMKSDD